jgi:hypothetical protein
MDMFSGYLFDSYIYNINLETSSNLDNTDQDSFNYLAIRGYSPSEQFQTVVRFYLPSRYDFGYVSLHDLSNEILLVNSITNVNPDYSKLITTFNSAFSTSKIYGSVGVAGFAGSNITTSGFGDFLNTYNVLNSTIISYTTTISTVNSIVNSGISSLVNGDLKYILPSFITSRTSVTDAIPFQIPFSTIMAQSNRTIEQYGMGYNLGYPPVDTSFNTIHRAESFFKLLDDYIYLQLNPEFNMNRLDISKQENLAQTQDATAEKELYTCKLILNSFGSFSTTLIQNPVMFNPPIGKLDKLSFAWYDVNGILINNSECEWSGGIQIVEKIEDSS